MFSTHLKNFRQIWNCCLQTLSVWKSKLLQFERVWNFPFGKGLTTKCWLLTTLGKKSFENIVEKKKMRVTSLYFFFQWVLRGSVVKCLTSNPGVLGSSSTGSSGIFEGVSLGKTLQSPSLVLVKPGKTWIMWAVAMKWLKYCWKWHKTQLNILFPQYFLLCQVNLHHLWFKPYFCLQMIWIWTWLKFCDLVQG